MGCDIHLHQEVKINGQWHHYGAPRVPRSYLLFGLMAGVRMDVEGGPVSLIKGLPSELTVVTQMSLDHWTPDGHSHSWLSWNEIASLYTRWEEYAKSKGWDSFETDLDHHYFGYLESNSWSGGSRGYLGIEDVRFIFWFDN